MLHNLQSPSTHFFAQRALTPQFWTLLETESQFPKPNMSARLPRKIRSQTMHLTPPPSYTMCRPDLQRLQGRLRAHGGACSRASPTRANVLHERSARRQLRLPPLKAFEITLIASEMHILLYGVTSMHIYSSYVPTCGW